MGEVIPFRAEARRRAAAPKPEGPAQILFFLGVRYCRQDEAAEGTAGSGRRRRSTSAAPRSRRKKRA